MPKTRQIIPSDVLETSKLNRNASKEHHVRNYERGEAKSIPQVENPNIEKNSFKGKSHYFQQFHETKRFVDSFLRKHKTENSIESEIRKISISTNLPNDEKFVVSPYDTMDIPHQSRNVNVSEQRPRTAGMNTTKTRQFEVHFGVRSKDYTSEDLQYYRDRFFDKSLAQTVEETFPSSPDKVFDERTSKRTKKNPKILSNFKQEVAIVREEVFPEWITMRENAMAKLINVVATIISSSKDEKIKYRQEFMSLLTVVQRSTLKIVEFYISSKGQFDLRLQNATREEQLDIKWQTTMGRWNEWVTYVEELPTSMNWLEENPYKLWSGIHFTLNPLLASFDLHNELAVVLNERLHEVIQSTRSTLFHIRTSKLMSNPAVVHDLAKQIASIHNIELPTLNSEPAYLPEIINIMAKELRYDESLHHRLTRASEVLCIIHDANEQKMADLKHDMETIQEQKRNESAFSPDIAHYNRLTFLVFRSSKLEDLDNKANIVRGNTKNFNTKNYFHLWQRCKYYEVSVRYMAKRRKLRIFHWILSGLRVNKIQKYRLIALRERVLKSQLNVLWDRWRRNVNWWKRFDSLYERCNRNRVQYAVDKWQEYLDEKQKERISCLLPLLQPEFQRQHQIDIVRDSPENTFSSIKIFEWLKVKALHWIEIPVHALTNSLNLTKLANISCRSPFRSRRPHHHQIDDDENDHEEQLEPPKVNTENLNNFSEKNTSLVSQKRILLRGMEEMMAESVANILVLQKRGFRAWRSAYVKRIILHRLCFIMQDYQVWAAWRQWRACMKEWRFEAKIEKRTQDMLREMTLLNSDRSSPSPASFLSMMRPSQRSLFSRSMSATTDGGDFEDNDSIGQFKNSEGKIVQSSWGLSSDSHDNIQPNQQYLNQKSPLSVPTTEKADPFSNNGSFQSPVRALCLKDVPIVYRRRQRFSDNDITTENSGNESVADKESSHTAEPSYVNKNILVTDSAVTENAAVSEREKSVPATDEMRTVGNNRENVSASKAMCEELNETECVAVVKEAVEFKGDELSEIDNKALHLAIAEVNSELNCDTHISKSEEVGGMDSMDYCPIPEEKETIHDEENIVCITAEDALVETNVNTTNESALLVAQSNINSILNLVMGKTAKKYTL